MHSRIFTMILSVVLVFSGFSCRTSKQLTKWASEEERRGNYVEALNLYFEAFQKKKENRQARRGLNRTAENLVEEYLDEQKKYHESGDWELSYDAYEKAVRFRERMKSGNIKVTIPDENDKIQEITREKYARQLYQEAASALEHKEYGTAQQKLDKIVSVYPSYPNVSGLRTAIKAAPSYDKAIDAYRNGHYSDALKSLYEVSNVAPGYRDSDKLKESILQQHSVKLAVLPIANKSETSYVESVLEARLYSELFSLNEPLLTVTDKDRTKKILEDLKIYTIDPTNDTLLASVGRRSGGSQVFLGEVMNVKYELDKPSEKSRTAYTRENVIRIDPWTGARYQESQYREVTYKEVTVENRVTLIFRFKIVDTQTGKISWADAITKSVINQVKYAEYSGDPETLYPSTTYMDGIELKRWRSIFKANKDVKSENDMVAILLEEISKLAARAIRDNLVN